MLRSFIHVILTINPLLAFSQAFTPPETGQTIDQSFQVVLMQKLPSECVALWVSGPELNVKVVIEKSQLEAQIATVHPNLWDSKPLLALLKNKPKGSSGCVELAYEDIFFLDSVFDVSVTRGHAMILDGNSNVPAPYAVVRYSANAAFGGHVFYSIPGQRPFKVSMWWIR
jgi:hypothetical protein